MTLQEFVDRAREKGHIFAVEFVKRTDGTVREMVCRTGVTNAPVSTPPTSRSWLCLSTTPSTKEMRREPLQDRKGVINNICDR